MPPLPPKCNHLSPSALLPANLSHHCFLPGLLQVPPTILSVSALALLTSVFYTAARINLLKQKSYPKTEVIPPVFSHLTQQRSFSDLSGLTVCSRHPACFPTSCVSPWLTLFSGTGLLGQGNSSGSSHLLYPLPGILLPLMFVWLAPTLLCLNSDSPFWPPFL